MQDTDASKKNKKPTNAEKLEIIEQSVGEITVKKTDKFFTVNNVNVPLYTINENSVFIDSYYISITDYCNVMGVKADGGDFMYSIKYPEIILADKMESSSETNTKRFFININGCHTMIERPRYNKYGLAKLNIHNAFLDCLNQSNDVEQDSDTPEEVISDIKEFQMFDRDDDAKLNNNDISNIIISIEQEFNSLKDEIKKLRQENEELKKHKTCSLDENKLKELRTFVTRCEEAIDPFADSYILDILSIILNKATQEHITEGKYCFISDFNAHIGSNVRYKDQIKEYENEPFTRIAMRIYGYKVLDFGLNSKYKDAILHQFKNMFGINITTNKFVLNFVLGLLTRKVEPRIANDMKLSTSILFEMPQY